MRTRADSLWSSLLCLPLIPRIGPRTQIAFQKASRQLPVDFLIRSCLFIIFYCPCGLHAYSIAISCTRICDQPVGYYCQTFPCEVLRCLLCVYLVNFHLCLSPTHSPVLHDICLTRFVIPTFFFLFSFSFLYSLSPRQSHVFFFCSMTFRLLLRTLSVYFFYFFLTEVERPIRPSLSGDAKGSLAHSKKFVQLASSFFFLPEIVDGFCTRNSCLFC
jgi:hypothetical protein